MLAWIYSFCLWSEPLCLLTKFWEKIQDVFLQTWNVLKNVTVASWASGFAKWARARMKREEKLARNSVELENSLQQLVITEKLEEYCEVSRLCDSFASEGYYPFHVFWFGALPWQYWWIPGWRVLPIHGRTIWSHSIFESWAHLHPTGENSRSSQPRSKAAWEYPCSKEHK